MDAQVPPPTLPPTLQAWRARGRELEVAGHSVFVVEEGSGPPVVVLHGFPSCSLDWGRVLERWTRSHRVIVHDHLGFGLSDKPTSYSYSLVDQADIALLVWRALGVERAHVIAHDYGTSVATELLARHRRGLLPVELASVTLCNGSMILELAQLTLLQQLLRRPSTGPLVAQLATPAIFERAMRKTTRRRDAFSAEELEALWAAQSYKEGRLRLPAISAYLDERVRLRVRWIDELPGLRLPTHLLWGEQDPIAVAEIPRRLAGLIPGARLTWLKEIGHYPMVEAPEVFAEAASAFWRETDGAR